MRVGSLGNEDLAEFPGLTHPTHLLDHRVVTQVVARRVAQPASFRERDQSFGFRGGDGQGFLAENVLAGFERGFCQRHV